MEKAKTHFPQVPLTVVRSVVEEQAWLEAMMNPEPKKKTEGKDTAELAEEVEAKVGKFARAKARKGNL